MAKLTSDITDSTLLCERCGYVLEGLDEAGACPECGQRIAESLPSRRTGTPFQIYEGLPQLIRQSTLLFSHPNELFGRMKIGLIGSDEKLLRRCCQVSGALLVLPSSSALFRFSNSVAPTILWLGPLLLAWMLAWLGLELLTLIERMGVVFFARKREWRIGKEIARAVCAMAAPGWIAAGIFLNVGLLLQLGVLRVAIGLPHTWYPWAQVAAASLPLLGFIAGMLVFETLVYIGVRRCKYANWVQRPVRGDEPAPALQAEKTRTD